MYLLDVNILVSAHREDVAHHAAYQAWLESLLNGSGNFGYSELVLSGFLRVVTHPRIFEEPSPLSSALMFTQQIRDAQNSVCIAPGAKHWAIFTQCLESLNACGNDVADSYHAALAMEWRCEWVSADKGFKRFKGLKWRHPATLFDC
ncbi:type II toxin-antitoxin system VapC family toxin [Methylotuvimicrobium buryatense]|uniref:Ribonuclease VapC n=1 Tax=Methylotuvimicrobium buryatense TaxID=95641 RepID=A0A4P9UTR3_METBY|nr:type II toxin-antitoxin system VapC family toxin [Methylotuvimicrobium buryatense]QCW83993.1 PIN domain-containing protein [Methylotuvimicrobium buryatense]